RLRLCRLGLRSVAGRPESGRRQAAAGPARPSAVVRARPAALPAPRRGQQGRRSPGGLGRVAAAGATDEGRRARTGRRRGWRRRPRPGCGPAAPEAAAAEPPALQATAPWLLWGRPPVRWTPSALGRISMFPRVLPGGSDARLLVSTSCSLGYPRLKTEDGK